jgi:hypothetical protein
VSDIFYNLLLGFVGCFQPMNLILLVAGTIIGLVVGVLPGLTLVMGVVLALPFTYPMEVTPAIVLLTAMYVTGTYGGAFHLYSVRIGQRSMSRFFGMATPWLARDSRPRLLAGLCMPRFSGESCLQLSW